ncbi:hypothetical protein Btru_060036 [Bulinus truncatus]|nr:hypothetical protein Btru_060036 [Bulinus truncatus]
MIDDLTQVHHFIGNGTTNHIYEHVTGGNTLIRKHNLRCKCNHHIVSMGFKRKIKADDTDESVYTILEFESDPSGGGLVRIKGQATNKYLCFSLKGKLIDRTVGKSKKCLFRETEIGGYIELISAANCRWKVGFNKRGRRMSGAFQQKTKRQDCYKFKKEKCSSCERNQDYTTAFYEDQDAVMEQVIFRCRLKWTGDVGTQHITCATVLMLGMWVHNTSRVQLCWCRGCGYTTHHVCNCVDARDVGTQHITCATVLMQGMLVHNTSRVQLCWCRGCGYTTHHVCNCVDARDVGTQHITCATVLMQGMLVHNTSRVQLCWCRGCGYTTHHVCNCVDARDVGTQHITCATVLMQGMLVHNTSRVQLCWCRGCGYTTHHVCNCVDARDVGTQHITCTTVNVPRLLLPLLFFFFYFQI